MSDELATAKHVLVVEDEPDFAALLRSVLSGKGYTVATAYDCEEGWPRHTTTSPTSSHWT